MPGKPTNQENIEATQENEQMPNEYPEQVIRELTQTDKLNKKLLTSFLQRMNNSAGEFAARVANEEQNGDSANPSENDF